MAIPSNYIDKITKGNDSRDICPAADKVRVNNENFEGSDLDGVLDEIAESISGAGGGTVKSVTINGTPHTPDSQGDVDLGTITGAKGDKGDKGDTVVLDPSQVEQFDIINGLNAQSAGDALDAYQGAQLKAKINEVYTRLKSVYAALGNIAFWDGKPAASTILPDLDWGLPKHIVTLDLSLTNAVVKHNGTAVADGATIQVEEYTTLTLTIEADTAGYLFANAPTVTLGGTSVTPTANQDGSYSVQVTMGQADATLAITATAAAAYSITYGTMKRCSTTTAPTIIAGGDTATIVFSVDSGFSLTAAGISVTGADIVSFSSGTLVIGNATGAVSVSAIAYSTSLKFLKEHWWMAKTLKGDNPEDEYLVNGVNKGLVFAASQMMLLPKPSSNVSAFPTTNVHWGLNVAANTDVVAERPVIIQLHKVDGAEFTPLGAYYLRAGSTYKASISTTSWSFLDGHTTADVISAYNAGKLGVRLSIAMNSAKTALEKGSSYGFQFGSFTFQPDSPAGNYTLITDNTDFEDDVYKY